MTFSEQEITREAERLSSKGLRLLCENDDIRSVARQTLAINRIKKEKNAVIAVHVYQRPEIMAGIADFLGDSYKLAKDCAGTKADRIIFCGVKFMAETAKMLSPEKTVILPAPNAGCSLSESISAAEVRAIKASHPGAPAICYINTSAAVKAECDCVVTSANAEKILTELYKTHRKLIFLPDRLMGTNLAKSLGKKIGEEIILWHGTCMVHENFHPLVLQQYRQTYPGIRILTHAEALPEFASAVDYVGGTSSMMDYVAKTDAPAYLLVTECGFGELAKMKFPEKNFIPMCRICPHMKYTSLRTVLQALEQPEKEQITEVDAATSAKAVKAIEKMFEMAEKK